MGNLLPNVCVNVQVLNSEPGLCHTCLTTVYTCSGAWGMHKCLKKACFDQQNRTSAILETTMCALRHLNNEVHDVHTCVHLSFEKEPRLIKDVYKACRDNQHRMKVDPFEVMLMRMGFNVARSNGESSDEGEDERGDHGDRGGPAWVQDPSACRQS